MMRFIYTKLQVIVLILVSMPSFASDHHLLNLVSPYFPPYTYERNGQIIGIGPDLIKRVLANTDIPYKITMVEDYGMAVQVMKSKLADGMFLASQNSERDAIAIFTKPLMINNWSWFMLKDSKIEVESAAFKIQAGIGTIKGTNTSKWLKKNGYTTIAQPVNAQTLVAMLKSNRIDAAFVADAVFENELSLQELSQFKKVVEVKKPFGMYISRDYLKKVQSSLKQINNSIEKITNHSRSFP